MLTNEEIKEICRYWTNSNFQHKYEDGLFRICHGLIDVITERIKEDMAKHIVIKNPYSNFNRVVSIPIQFSENPLTYDEQLILDLQKKIDELNKELRDWKKLESPEDLHVNLLRGVPCQLTQRQLFHIAGVKDYEKALLSCEDKV